ncbi:MAG: D-alanyl-D-alanine carboxypeptidase [Ruminococcus sp.]|nr:D-alanyl-D-alanine carboxypeptidase [Ruminococcus sp.]
MKPYAALTLTAILLLCTLTFAGCKDSNLYTYPREEQMKSQTAILINMDNQQPVYEKAADKRMFPASTTKIMTYIIARESIDDLDATRIQVKQELLDQLLDSGCSMAHLNQHVGETMSARDMFYSMLLPSGTDATLALADYVGNGNLDTFVEMMNDKAKTLGCKNTHFTNPSGLHDDNHYTTARDLSTITQYALSVPDFATITNTKEWLCEGDTEPLTNTNYMIDPAHPEFYYPAARGIKTGTTDQAGRCLVTSADSRNRKFLLVLMGAPYQEGKYVEYDTFTDAKDIFNWALNELQLKQ